VLKTALALADEHGLEALSMRRLAHELGVEAMSLYNHVEGKDDLIDGMIDLVANEIELPADGVEWKTALRESTISSHDTLLRHRWVGGIWMSPRQVSATRLRQSEAVLRTFREAGFSEDLTYHAFHILTSHVIGFTLYELSFPIDRKRLKQMAARFMREFPADEYPDLAAHIRQHTEPADQKRSTFEFALDLILDGLEHLRDAELAQARKRPPRRRRSRTNR
jgi:AcrR family transcriptional regulator